MSQTSQRFFAIGAIAGLLALAACAGATPYQPAPAERPAGAGFSEQRLEGDRYRVSFQGNSITERETVETYLLFRAAELTLQNGFDHFILAARATDETTSLQPTGLGRRDLFYDWAYWHPAWGWRRFGWRGYDPFFDEPEYVVRTRFRATAELVMARGPKPAGDPAAFDARELQANLAPTIRRPAPR